MFRRAAAVVTVAALGVVAGAGPARADHGTAHTIAQMTAHYRDPGLEPQNKPFALLYLRTTEGMWDANAEGEFSAPEFWDQEVIPTFADYYLDAYAAWDRHRSRDVDPAWRIAFRTADVDIFAWRELAWQNGQALLAAPDRRAREAIARQIRDHARDQAREILRWG
jgi:hypothetical protein